ncbi:MAG: hypothetical protein A3G33_06170 [Omnitrophica bacterium RIFCSPLOWO2_12_FULL_44_17]|uniref:histidine kinase n=1 Tax=Candidatus Danuiimicrobium aquiferis TaxID=1801832 RepID=A0A1G1KS36_9BACT|nr:MAG: hypothetical protein A3B72_02655 [Omnitrophica bacterium RIFCSPHIGHO2_02_FULL_45_28]OGW95369.1 MAG: hypothetical protein A3G33_06170 [Omnitrophica bacterium RIFCSPLOWO2_12_FULL_44_17]OGX04071.1 MAG: hypothetical protein A3J12_08735 [Omnitrophica bacterium RIFCSPLOWO2_02_FULL_44_11]
MSENRKILIIEDSPTYQRALADELVSRSYDIICANSGEEGLELIKENPPDLIVLDVMLPQIQGYPVCRLIKSNPHFRHIPVIILTLLEGNRIMPEAIEAGADSFINKQAPMSLIVRRIDALLKMSIAAKLFWQEEVIVEEEEISLAGKKILLMDDDLTYLQILKRELVIDGYQVMDVTTGEQCFEKVKEEMPDLILLSLEMSDLEGTDVCREIHKAKRFYSVPVLMLTPTDSREQIIRSFEAGANDCVAKTDNLKLIKLRIISILKRKYFEEEMRKVRTQLSGAEMKMIIANSEKEIQKQFAQQLEEKNKLLEKEIAERQVAEELSRKLSRAVEQSPVTVVVTDTEGRIEYVNPKFIQLTGYAYEEALGQNPRVFKSGEHSALFYKELWETITAGKEWRGEFHNKKKNGELYWEFASISPVRNLNGEITHYIAVKEDITERKRAEEELKRSKTELETQAWGLQKANDSIKMLYKQLEERNKELQKLDILKSEFVSTVSHELRTPMAIIREGVSQVLEGILGDINVEQKEFLTISLENIDRLGRIINDLLDISKLEAGRVELRREWFDLVSIVNDAIKNYKLMDKASAKGVELRTKFSGERIEVYADRDKLIQIIMNLINNALKFTEEGFIEVAVEDCEDRVECKVSDTGRGISEDDLQHIFVKFRQFDRKDGPGKQGTGLGLTICKALVELHGGTMTVDSKAGVGTTFRFILPEYSMEEILREAISSGMKEAEKLEEAFSAMLMSIDSVETKKHLMDEATYNEHLQQIGKIAYHVLRRSSDKAIGIGGCKLLMTLPVTNGRQALIVQARIEEKINEYLEKEALLEHFKVRFSIASYPSDGSSSEALWNRLFPGGGLAE